MQIENIKINLFSMSALEKARIIAGTETATRQIQI